MKHEVRNTLYVEVAHVYKFLIKMTTSVLLFVVSFNNL